MCDGFAFFPEDKIIPFHFENGYLELFLGSSHFTFGENTITVVGQKRDVTAGGYVFYHLLFPFENYVGLETHDAAGGLQKTLTSIGTVRQEVDFYIDGFVSQSKFTKMIFSFPELNYFIPSSSICSFSPDDHHVEFLGSPQVITSFQFEYRGQTVNFSLKVAQKNSIGSIKCCAETSSLLELEFTETNDLDFLLELYYRVQFLFGFLCNRQNIALDSITLIGKSIRNLKRANGTKMVKEIPVSSNLYVVNKHKAKYEDTKVISRTIQYNNLEFAFKKLFSLFLNDSISVSSIHSSLAARNILDLKQCLNITSAFEYYQRTFLPKILSKETIQVYDEVSALIQKYVDAQSGRKKKKAKHLLGSISPNVSLKDKICKVYNGYDSWPALKPILSEYFGEDVSEVASVANEWRNELAHEKREYEPDHNVISAIRLVEHINYCIVFRIAGYPDDEIKVIVEKILAR